MVICEPQVLWIIVVVIMWAGAMQGMTHRVVHPLALFGSSLYAYEKRCVLLPRTITRTTRDPVEEEFVQ